MTDKKTGMRVQFAFFDLETDPFAFEGEEDPKQSSNFDIVPFACGCLYAPDFRPYFVSWGGDCIADFMREVDANPVPTIYYAHNGGRFDMRWLMEYLPAQKFLKINGRLVKATYGIHEFRDSFALFAMKLSAIGGKLEIDYKAKMSRSTREANKAEILEYLYTDCDVLRNAVMGLIETSKMRAGKFAEVKATAAAIAFKSLVTEMTANASSEISDYRDEVNYKAKLAESAEKVKAKPTAKPRAVKKPVPRDPKYRLNILGMPYPFVDFSPLRSRDTEDGQQYLKRKREWDLRFRPYYFGGTVRVGRAGVFEGEFTQIDARSMYSTSMVQFAHPISDKSKTIAVNLSPENVKLNAKGELVDFPGHVFAIEFIGLTVGILATFREGVNTLGFRRDINRMISHEFQAGIELGMIEIETILSVTVFERSECTDFRPFSEKFYALRNEEKALRGKDKESEQYKIHDARQLYYKTMLASAYGKLAQDYSNFKDTYWKPADSESDIGGPAGWDDVIEERPDADGRKEYYVIGKEKETPVTAESENYYNVLTAASITSGARALLMRKMAQVVAKGHEFIYCDTDSVLFSGKPDADIATGADALGHWAIDLADVYKVAIAGAKTYALYYTENGRPEKVNKLTGKSETLVKTRSKGAVIPHAEVVRIADDPTAVYRYVSEAPQSGLHGEMMALVRDVQATAKPVPYGTIADYRARGVEPRQLINANGVRYTVRELRAMETPAETTKREAKATDAKTRKVARLESESPAKKAKREKEHEARKKAAKEKAAAKRASKIRGTVL